MQFDNSTLRVYPEIFSRNPEVRRLPTLPSFATQRAGSRMRAMMQNHTLPTRSWKPIEVDRRNSRARTVSKRPAPVVLVQAVSNVGEDPLARRTAISASAAAVLLAAAFPDSSEATPKRRPTNKIDESLYLDLPGTEPAIKYYDLKGAGGTMGGAKNGQRVAVHFDVKWRGLTIATSRQGAGVTGGVPYGFDVGVEPGNPGGPFIQAFNEGIKGMGVGTVRSMIVPPEYAYGNRQVQEIPPNATLQVDLELLSIKKDNVLGK